MQLKIMKLDECAIVPKKVYDTDIGIDIYTPYEYVVKSGTVQQIFTRIAVEFQNGFGGLLTTRSSYAIQGLFVVGGVIDTGYRGEIIVLLYNSSALDQYIRKESKVAQLILLPVQTVDIVNVSKLNESERGVAGFGSSGK